MCEILHQYFEIIENGGEFPVEKETQLLTIAIQCLQDFMKYNFYCQNCTDVKLDKDLFDLIEKNSDGLVRKLSPSDEYIPAESDLRHLHLLSFACDVLFATEEVYADIRLWRLRALFIKQMILNEPDYRIYETIIAEIEKIEDTDCRTNLEICQIFLWFRDISKSKVYYDKAYSQLNIEFDLKGRLGKRTKWQSDSKPQLFLNINRLGDSHELTESRPATDKKLLPLNVALDDDTLLSDVKYDEEETDEIRLNFEEQALICTMVAQHMKSSAYEDVLKREESTTYLQYLIDYTDVWSIKYKCLHLRSILESDERRRIERSLKQLEQLVKTVTNCDQCSIRCNYSILIEPIWTIERSLADLLFELGCTKSALDIYEKLQLWENMVDCYKRLGRKNKAEEIIRQQLANGKTPYLLCLLGDVTDDISHYEAAFELSNGRSYRAKKSLGDYHFFRREYEECIPFYTISLELNSMQHSAWSRLAFAALSTEKYALCVKAYRRVVDFDPDSFEAWNNLSNAYIKLGDKQRAFKTLREALKCNFEEWKIWENFLLVSFDIGAFGESINAWHRLIDIKGKHEDDQILEMLVNYIEDHQSEVNSKLLSKLQTLFGRIAVTSSGSHLFWRLYARVLIDNNEPWDKFSPKLRTSYQCLINKVQLKSADDIMIFTQDCLRLIKLYESIKNRQGSDEDKRLFVASFRLSLKSAITVIKSKDSYYVNDGEKREEIEKNIEEIEAFVTKSSI